MQREEESSLAQESSAIIDYRIGIIESTIVEKNLEACGRFYLLRSAVIWCPEWLYQQQKNG
ncbi:MAG: hypothetical protein H0W28_12435 [Pyrinomonadaceae bacterium]|nr:hypothetical protein [Pyrinomonadaceae bacterium]